MVSNENWRKEIVEKLRERNKRESGFAEIIKYSKEKISPYKNKTKKTFFFAKTKICFKFLMILFAVFR